MTALTASQQQAMMTLSNYVGQTVDVLTSQYSANVSRDFVARSVGIFNAAALRGLEKKGFISMKAFWKGATVTVLKPLEA